LVSIIPLVLLLIGGTLSRLDGIILLVIFVVYARHLLKERQAFSKQSDEHSTRWQTVRAPVVFLGALVVLFVSSYFTVKFATTIAMASGIAPIMIGLILIALGTSLPELSFTINAFLNHKGDLSLGNLIGSVVANSTMVLGVAAILSPIIADPFILATAGIFMLLSTFLFLTFIERKDHITTGEGLVLITVYVGFIVTQVYLPTL